MKIRYLIILFIFFLVGCSSINIKKDKFVKEIDAKFNDMLEISEQELTNYYGINTNEFADFVFKISKNEPLNIYVLVLPISKKNAKKEINKFFDRLTSISSKNIQKRIKDKYYNTYDDYLFYIVSDNNKSIYKEMKEFIKK